jgi:hypothetical protein
MKSGEEQFSPAFAVFPLFLQNLFCCPLSWTVDLARHLEAKRERKERQRERERKRERNTLAL